MLSELKALPQWIIRRADKIPLQVAEPHERASVNIPEQWSTFEVASAFCKDNPEYGLGFVITPSCPFSFIDLDNARDPKHNFTEEQIQTIVHNQNEVYAAFLSYTELSPSGSGVHIIVRGKMPTNKKKQCIEVYSFGRYMTMTFNAVEGRNIPILNAPELLKTLWDDMGGLTSTLEEIHESEPETKTDAEVIEQAANASNGELFKSLFNGDISGYDNDESRADLALINIIAFYTDNKPQAVRIFRASKLGKRKKAKREDYFYNPRWGIVNKAFDQKGKDLSLEQLVQSVADQLKEITAVQADAPPPVNAPLFTEVTEDTTYPLDFPSGMVGDIARYIYANAINPVKEVAIAAAVAYFAGLVGRAYNYSNTGLNQYIILLANSGGGKDAAGSGIDKINKAMVDAKHPSIMQFVGPGTISSPQSLFKYFQEQQCFLSHISEVGHWMQKICSKNAKDNDKIMRAALLVLFDKSGHGHSIKPIIFADSAKNTVAVDSPCFSLFGDSTRKEFYKALDEDNVSEGLVSRLTIVECPDKRPVFRKEGNTLPVPESMIEQLTRYLNAVMIMNGTGIPKTVAQTEDAETYHLQLQQQYADKQFADVEGPLAQIWNRGHLKVLRLAALLAIGESVEQPCVTIEHIKWADNLVMKGIMHIAERFDAGKVGEGNLQNDQQELMANVLLKYWNSKFTPAMEKTYSISKEMHDLKVITYRYLQMNMVKHACFRNDRNGTTAFKNIVQMFVQMGHLTKFDITKLKPGARGGEAFHIYDIAGLKTKV